MAFSPDGQRLLSVSRDHAVRIWNVHTGQLLFPALSGAVAGESAGFAGDGRRLVTVSSEGTIRFWDASTGQALSPLLQHSSLELRICLNPQATLMATAARDGSIRVFELPTGRILSTTGPKTWKAQDLQFTPESSRLVIAGSQGRIHFYDVRTGLLIHETAKHGWTHVSLQLAPDGQSILTTRLDYARVWPGLPGAPAPGWLAPLAEAVAGHRLNAARETEPVPVKRLLEIEEVIKQSTATDPYTRWARWFLADRLTRPQSPVATRTVAEHVQNLIALSTPDALREALRCSPTNREAFARLAKVLRDTNTNNNAALAAEAAWCEHKANEPLPR